VKRAPRASRAQRATEADEHYMRRCLELAHKYRGRTAPNPIVGCVIVKDGRALAEGVHKGPGTKHAEADALAKLKGKAPGATMYVNMEPCMHHGLTPPCVPAIRESGIARVVVGTDDPIPGHGGGVPALRRSGIETVHALTAECNVANEPFLTWAVYDRPAYTLKAGVTLDGKIATVGGESQYITHPGSRYDVFWQRNWHDAILVGIGTVLADDPDLGARLGGIDHTRDPLRVVLDSELRTPPTARVLPKNRAKARRDVKCIIACGKRAPKDKEAALVAKGAEVLRLPQHANGNIQLHELGHELAFRKITSVLVEGGGHVHWSFLTSGFADRVILYMAPIVVGGPAPSWVGGPGLKSLGAAHKLQVDNMEMSYGDIKISLSPRPPPPPKPVDPDFFYEPED
jgi:diaminohydroxyphosphoribosylaminopyrimidine deaminase/5-amino-6-(5-phosphoribosylamino)uracil reductase